MKKDDSVGYRALVQTEDHLLLFLQQLGEWASLSCCLWACPWAAVRPFIGAVARLLGRLKCRVFCLFFPEP